EVEYLHDIAVRELDGNARLVDEATDEPALPRGVGQDSLERLDLLESGDADGLHLVDLGHPALRDLLEDVILPDTLAQRFHRVQATMRRGGAGYSELAAVLGVQFNGRALLEQALRHPSCCNEQGEPRPEDSERREFLGAAVLDLVVAHRVMTRFPNAH